MESVRGTYGFQGGAPINGVKEAHIDASSAARRNLDAPSSGGRLSLPVLTVPSVSQRNRYGKGQRLDG